MDIHRLFSPSNAHNPDKSVPNKENTTRPCVDVFDLERSVLRYLLPASIVFAIGLSFLVRRQRLRPGCCSGRPALLSPFGDSGDTSRRWQHVACFIAMAHKVMGLFSSAIIWDPLEGMDTLEKEFKYDWLQVIIGIANVTHIWCIFYPLFVCTTLHKHVAANIAGFIYTVPMVVVDILVLVRCWVPAVRVGGADKKEFIHVVALLIAKLPALVALTVVLLANGYDFVVNINNCRKRLLCRTYNFSDGDVKNASPTNADITDSASYVKELFRKRANTGQKTRADSLVAHIRTELSNFKLYTTVPGFRYPLKLISTLAVSAAVLITTAIVSVVALDFILKYALDRVDYYVISLLDRGIDVVNSPIYENTVDALNSLRVGFRVSVAIATTVQLVSMSHIIVSYKRRWLMMLRGKHDWHCKMTASHPSRLASSLRYPGYQISFIIYGWSITFAVLAVITLGCVTASIPFIRSISWNLAKMHWPSALTALLLLMVFHLLTIILIKYVFLSRCEGVYVQNNRRLFHIAEYFLFLFNIAAGFIAGAVRLGLSVVTGILLLPRLDYPLLSRAFDKFDPGYETFLSMLIIDVQNNHPVMKTFVQLICHAVSTGSHAGSEAQLRRRRARNRWYKAVTLVNNPTLIHDRQMRQMKSVKVKQDHPREACIQQVDEDQGNHGDGLSFSGMRANGRRSTLPDSSAVSIEMMVEFSSKKRLELNYSAEDITDTGDCAAVDYL